MNDMKTQKKNKEIRNCSSLIRRKDNESRMVEGIAVVFNSDSQNMGFIENISPEAITQETIDNSDIFAYLNHDESRGVLARRRYGKGTLQLRLQDDGLYYSFEAPHTQLGDELLEYLNRGEITTSSFAFIVDENDGDEWESGEDGVLHRRIKKIYKICDVSPVFEPAYLETECVKRKIDTMQSLIEKLDGINKEIENL